MAINQLNWDNAYKPTSGTLNVLEALNYPNSTYNGQQLSNAQLIARLSQDTICYNSYENAWLTKGLRTIQIEMAGTKQYSYTFAAMPVSNYSPFDYGNRSFATGFQVYGMPIMFLQTNFWFNEFQQAIDAKTFTKSLQDLLLNSYQKSIKIVKAELSIMEAVLFSLATGQFFLVDELGEKVAYDPLDPNNLNMWKFKVLWSTQQPQKIPQQTYLGNTTKSFIHNELNMLSKWLMKFPLSINQFAIGYDLNKIHLDVSYYARTNLAEALNLGWPTDTNMKILGNKSYDGATLSQWLNITLTDTGTLPFLQNDIGMVAQENYPNQVLGYGINNVSSGFSYLKNVVGYVSHEGSIEQYTTPYIPFNPYTDSKTYYRLGGVWGWGQVHLPILANTNYALIDSQTYIQINSQTQAATTKADQDWVATLQDLTTVNIDVPTGTTSNLTNYYIYGTNPQYTATKILNGIEYTVQYTMNIQQLLDDILQAQSILTLWEPGMNYAQCYWGGNDGDGITNANWELGSGVGQVQNSNSLINDYLASNDSSSPLPATWTMGHWLQYRSLRGLSKVFLNSQTNNNSSLMDVFKVGDFQFLYCPNMITSQFPADAPSVQGPGV